MQRYNISDYQCRKFCLFRRLKILFYIKENSFYHLSTSFYHLYQYSLFFFRQYLPYILLIKDGAQGFQDALCTASGPSARKANIIPKLKQHNDCWQWDFLPNRLPKLPSYLWKSLRNKYTNWDVDTNCKLLIVSIFLPVGAYIFRLMVWRRGWCLSPNHLQKYDFFLIPPNFGLW